MLNLATTVPNAQMYERYYSKRLISILGLWVSVSEILVRGLAPTASSK